MDHEEKESLQVLLCLRKAGRIWEDAANHVWFVPTHHPVFNAVTMVAGPVSRQIEKGYVATGVEGTTRYGEISEGGLAFLARHKDAAAGGSTERWLEELLRDEKEMEI